MFGIYHCHSIYSLQDSPQSPDAIMKRASELGIKNVTLTDHGTLLGTEPFLDAGKKYNLNAIPGVEAYIENLCHLIIIPKNYEGFLAISHAMRDANENLYESKTGREYPILSENILLKYFKDNSNVIISSACVQGPIAYILLENYRRKKAENKIRKKYDSLEEYDLKWKQFNDMYLNCVQEIKQKNNECKSYKKYINKASLNKYETKKKKAEQTNDSFLVNEVEMMERNIESSRKIVNEINKEIDTLRSERNKWKKELDKATKKKNDRQFLKEQLDKIEYLSENKLYQDACDKALFYKNNFPLFYLELQYHGLEQEDIVMKQIEQMHIELEIPVIAANDAHITYNSEKDVKARSILRYNYFERHEEPSDIDRELYIKDEKQMEEALCKIIHPDIVNESIKNLDILDECNVVLPIEKHYPRVESPLSFEEILSNKRNEMIEQGEWSEKHEARFRHEVDVITNMGFIDYHMVVRDFVKVARDFGCVPKNELINIPNDFNKAYEWLKTKNFKAGIGAGPGRGSAVGSLVCYMLGITNIDPLKYNLLFERFLNPERVTMPDIDSDIKTSLRPIIIRYFKWKYGDKAVCSIVTEAKYLGKGAVQMAGRDYFSEKYQNVLPKKEYTKQKTIFLNNTIIKISEFIDHYLETEENPNNHISELNRADEEFKKHFDGVAVEIWERAKLIEGCISSTSIHAGGVVISDNDDINDYIPLAWNNKKKVWAAQCDMVRLEEKGLLKMDVLGLNTLDCESDCAQLIEKNRGILIDFDKIEFETEVFNEIFSKGLTNSIFQFESVGMKSMLKEFKPSCIEDLIILIAMYRPGPMQYLDRVIAVKNGTKKIEYKTEELKEILCDTYGAIVFQEQVMEIFQKLAGYSLGQADMVRRAMSKKKLEKLEIERKAFIYGDQTRNIDGCMNRGISEQIADELFDEMSEFARYAFNKSHAAAYAVVAYQTAWLKYHYPLEFFCSMFNNKEQVNYESIISDCRKFSISILPVSINHSYYDFTVEENSIRYGFRGIKDIGEKSKVFIDNVVKERKKDYFLNVPDFICRLINIDENEHYTLPDKSIMENFIKVGAFDELSINRSHVLETYHLFLDLKPYTKENLKLGMLKCDFSSNLPDQEYNRNMESDLLGFLISDDPLKNYKNDEYYDCTPIDELNDGMNSIFGFVISVEDKLSKKNNPMLILKIQGKADSCKVILMNALYDKYKNKNLINKVLKFTGSCKNNTMFCRKVELLCSKKRRFYYICDTEEKTKLLYQKLKNLEKGSECLDILLFYGGTIDALHKLEFPVTLSKEVTIDLINSIQANLSIKK